MYIHLGWHFPKITFYVGYCILLEQHKNYYEYK